MNFATSSLWLGLAISLAGCTPSTDAAPADAVVVATDTATDAPECSSRADCLHLDEPCRLGRCTTQQACVPETLPDGALCDDGGPCTASGACLAGSCSTVDKFCDDGLDCTLDGCLNGVCTHKPATGTACDDGDPCTAPGTCDDGACAPGPSICGCHADADCAAAEDGDPCNGTLYCDLSSTPRICRLDPSSVVQCSTEADTPCRSTACDPASGQCKVSYADEGASCDDEQPCTASECDAKGSCAQTAAKPCQCQVNANCAAFEDGNLCNGTLYCDKSAEPFNCKVMPSTVVQCNKGPKGACIAQVCTPKTGSCAAAIAGDGTACEDGNLCTQGDLCKGGICQAGGPACACVGDADCQPQEDGDACNGTLFCNLATHQCQLNPATIVNCPTVDDSACASRTCAPATGQCPLTATSGGGPCSDGNACTKGDVCADGECAPGKNQCPCQKDADCAAVDDGDVCNGKLFCHLQSKTCEVNPATVITCPTVDDTDCLKNLCAPKTGTCAPKKLKNDTDCDDGNPCTPSDGCFGGLCKGALSTCQCQQDLDCVKFEDGNLCNGLLYCQINDHTCQLNPATVVTCPSVDDTTCQRNLCQPSTGQCAMAKLDDGLQCQDGDPCTAWDVCQGGACKGGSPVCSCKNDADCAAFDDGDLCNGVTTCQKVGKDAFCKADPSTAVVCKADAGKPCTKASCLPKTGKCIAKPVADGEPCVDGDACTHKETCKAGQCGGPQIPCDDGNPCSVDVCVKGQCSHSNKSCDDGKPCTVDVCNYNNGDCVHAPAAANSPCNGGKGTCKAGLCVPA